jgi:SOS-response transcriptional repressor LexA
MTASKFKSYKDLSPEEVHRLQPLEITDNSFSPTAEPRDVLEFILGDGTYSPGDWVIVTDSQGKDICRKYLIKDGECWLKALNPECADILFDEREQYILGKVVYAHISKYLGQR